MTDGTRYSACRDGIQAMINDAVKKAMAELTASSNLTAALPPSTQDRGNSDDELVNVAQAALILDMSPSYLNKLRCTGGGPRFVRMSRKAVRYRRCDLRSYAEGRLADSTSEYAAKQSA
jgi:hypothetical protein